MYMYTKQELHPPQFSMTAVHVNSYHIKLNGISHPTNATKSEYVYRPVTFCRKGQHRRSIELSCCRHRSNKLRINTEADYFKTCIGIPFLTKFRTRRSVGREPLRLAILTTK